MKNLVIGLIALLLIVAGGFYMKKHQGKTETTGDVQEVKWDIKNRKGNEKVDINFQLFNKNNNEVRGVNDQIRAIIVDEQLKEMQQMKPAFAGNGSYKLSPGIEKDKAYTIFLYEDRDKTEQSFSKKKFGEEEKKKQKSLVGDSVLTKKIGDYQTSLLFGALHPNEAATLTFQFQTKKGERVKLSSNTGERAALYIIDEAREHFIYAVPVDDEEQLQYRITFPEEGVYKIWGDFYLNGKKYDKEFVIQVQKRKNS
ncbi:hypothetical protein [Bacillus gaemokensis]|uniref:Uncharacterized protein n=1 Tax=Bacillus gaemokensis TaxID=574375 RepID=A0A073K8T6_9BACI|nr:hypothetical protein [Bacillus gaemokensis]KEK23724.1 hypothetical protein BAGA_07130 [Bacillus gaemokensis]KYG26517.1 hypothetical protein AZF08_17175 [Bacillus gaemokensis]